MENSPSIKPIAYTYGALLAAYSILTLVLLYAFNVDQQNWIVATVNSLVSIIIFVLAIKAYKNKNNGYLSIKEAIKVGLGTAVISGVLVGIYSLIHYNFVYPEFVETLQENAYLQISDQGLSEDQIAKAMEITEFTTSAWFIATMSLLSSLIFGLIISLLAGLVMKRTNPAIQ